MERSFYLNSYSNLGRQSINNLGSDEVQRAGEEKVRKEGKERIMSGRRYLLPAKKLPERISCRYPESIGVVVRIRLCFPG